MKITVSLIFPVIISFLLGSCNNTVSPGDESIRVEISTQFLADQLGNKDGTASANELNSIEEFFNKHTEMWLMTNGICTDCKSVKSDTLRERFLPTSEPFESEQKLRDAYAGLSLKIPWVGVSKLVRSNSIFILKFYRAPGPDFSNSVWEEIKIKQ